MGAVTERRSALLLAVVLLMHLVALSAQTTSPTGETGLERAGLLAVRPLLWSLDEAFDAGARLRRSLYRRTRLQRENQELRAENHALALDLARLRGVEQELDRMAAATGFAPPRNVRAVPADVTFIDHRSFLRTLILRVADEDAELLRADLPVSSAEGLVGRIVSTSGPWARVQLITDRASSVGAMVERTRRQGIVQGGGESGGLVFDYLPLQADVRVGDRLVSAGIDGVYPRGSLVGEVTTAERGDDLFWEIGVIPAVDFGALDQVFVLITAPLPDELEAD